MFFTINFYFIGNTAWCSKSDYKASVPVAAILPNTGGKCTVPVHRYASRDQMRLVLGLYFSSHLLSLYLLPSSLSLSFPISSLSRSLLLELIFSSLDEDGKEEGYEIKPNARVCVKTWKSKYHDSELLHRVHPDVCSFLSLHFHTFNNLVFFCRRRNLRRGFPFTFTSLNRMTTSNISPRQRCNRRKPRKRNRIVMIY